MLGIWIAVPPYHQSTTLLWAVATAAWALGALFAVIGIRLKRTPPLNQLSIHPESIGARFSDGAHLDIPWSDPALGLTMFDYASDPQSAGAEKRHVWVAISKDRGGTISKAVKEALINAAREHHLPVLIRMEFTGRGHMAEVTRIGVPEKTPGWEQATPARR